MFVTAVYSKSCCNDILPHDVAVDGSLVKIRESLAGEHDRAPV